MREPARTKLLGLPLDMLDKLDQDCAVGCVCGQFLVSS